LTSEFDVCVVDLSVHVTDTEIVFSSFGDKRITEILTNFFTYYYY